MRKKHIEQLAKLGDETAKELLLKQMERDGRAICAEHGPYQEADYAKFDLEEMVRDLEGQVFSGYTWGGIENQIYTRLRKIRWHIREKHEVEIKWDIDQKEDYPNDIEIKARIHAYQQWSYQVCVTFKVKGKVFTHPAMYTTGNISIDGASSSTIFFTIGNTTYG